MLKKLKGWRTIIVGFLISFIGALDASSVVPIIPLELQPWAVAFLPAIFIGLRFVTTTRVGG